MSDERWPSGAYVAEFASEEELSAAVASLRSDGYSRMETYTPFPVRGIDAALGGRKSRLPVAAFVAGVTGAAAGYWVQWYANVVSYPLNIGRRPAHAVAAFFIPTFESAVIAAGITIFVGLFVALRLPRPWHPMFEVDGFERASMDRYWLAIDGNDARADFERTPRTLAELHPLRVAAVAGDR